MLISGPVFFIEQNLKVLQALDCFFFVVYTICSNFDLVKRRKNVHFQDDNEFSRLNSVSV